MQPRGRVAKFNKPVTERVAVYFTDDHMKEFEEQMSRAVVADFIRDSALEKLHGASTPPDESINYAPNESDRKALDALANELYYDDATALVRALVRAALNQGTDGIREFLRGRPQSVGPVSHVQPPLSALEIMNEQRAAKYKRQESTKKSRKVA